MKQPKAIVPIFFTEMWERFGYYAIQGLLVLFLIYRLNYSVSHSFVVLTEFVSWVYIAPLLGGLVADQILGYRYSILSGIFLLCIGYLLLAFEGGLFLHLSLAFIIVGNGLLKPNNPSYLGNFYYHDDPRRYPGFTFYFIGTNIGGLISVLLTSFASQYIGYYTAFGIVAFGMLIAAAAFIYGFRYFENRGFPIERDKIKPRFLQIISNRFILIMLLLIVVQIVHFLLHAVRVSEAALLIVAALVVVSLFYIQSSYNQTTRNHLIAIIILTTSSIIFWALQLQVFFSVLLFTNQYVHRHFFGVTIPAPFFIAMEPAFILLLGPFVGKIWQRLSARGKEPYPPIKFALGLLFVALAMSVLCLAAYLTPANQTLNPTWLVIFYASLTLAGLLVSPTGMAMITELAPPRLTGFMMGVWYMVIGLGGLLAGQLAQVAFSAPRYVFPSKAYGQYVQAFGFYALVALVISLLLIIISPQLKKLIRTQIP